MDRHQPGTLSQRGMERRHIGKSDEQLRVLCDFLIVQQRQDAGTAVAAAEAQDGLHRIVAEEIIDIPGPFRIGPGKETIIPSDRRHHLDAITGPFQPGYGRRNILAFIVCGRRCDADAVTAAQCRSPKV